MQTSGKLLDLYRTGGPVTTWKIQVLQVLQHFYRTSFFSKIRVPIEGLPTRFFLPDRRTGTAMVFNSPPLFSPVEDRGPVNFPMSVCDCQQPATFKLAGDIISGGYPIPSRPSSIVGPSIGVNFFFKSNRLPHFSSDHGIFDMNVHNNVGQKSVELEFWIFASIFFMDFWLQNWEFWRFLVIGSLSFHPIFPIFGLNVHNNIAHKIVGPEFLFFYF